MQGAGRQLEPSCSLQRGPGSAESSRRRAQVDLAIKILDGSYFRAGEATPISVQKAKFELHGEFQAKKRGNVRKRKKTAQIVEDKALGWGGFDDKIKDTEVCCALPLLEPVQLHVTARAWAELECSSHGGLSCTWTSSAAGSLRRCSLRSEAACAVSGLRRLC